MIHIQFVDVLPQKKGYSSSGVVNDVMDVCCVLVAVRPDITIPVDWV